MADDNEWKGGSWKQEADFSKETDVLLGEINAGLLPVLLRSTNRPVESFVDDILVLEKKARLGGDAISTTRLAVEALKLLRSQGQFKAMLAKLDFLMKRRGQMKQVQSAMIGECAAALENTTTTPAGDASIVEILTQLVHVTAGRIHVELEHARFTVRLATIAEHEQKAPREAANMLAELQVETITNMPRLEKITIVLEQLRLALALGDLSRLPTISRKVTHRALAKNDTRGLRIQYFRYMQDYFGRLQQSYMVAKCEYEIYLAAMGSAPNGAAAATTTTTTAAASSSGAASSGAKGKGKSGKGANENDDADDNPANADGTGDFLTPEMSAIALAALSNAVVLCLLAEDLSQAEHDQQAECCAFTPIPAVGSAAAAAVAKLPASLSLPPVSRREWLKQLEQHKKLAHELPPLHSVVLRFNTKDLIRQAVADTVQEIAANHPATQGSEYRRAELLTRLSEHDLLVVAGTYSRIRVRRLSELVALTEDQCEAFIMRMVNAGALAAKIDRVDGSVVFNTKRKVSEDVAEWTKATESVAALVDKAAHLVVKERMLYSLASTRQQQQQQ